MYLQAIIEMWADYQGNFAECEYLKHKKYYSTLTEKRCF